MLLLIKTKGMQLHKDKYMNEFDRACRQTLERGTCQADVAPSALGESFKRSSLLFSTTTNSTLIDQVVFGRNAF